MGVGAAAAAFFVASGAALLASWQGEKREALDRRLAEVRAVAAPEAAPLDPAPERPRRRRRFSLRRAGIPGAAVLLSLLGGAALGWAALRSPAGGLLGAAAGAILPPAYVHRRTQMRLRAFQNQLADALTLAANGLRSGYSFLQALDVVGAELPPPAGEEFAQVVRETRVGIPLEDALANLLERVPSADLDLMVTAVLIQRQVGGNLAYIFDRISETIRERVRLQGQMRAITAQGRLSGWIVGLLPPALGAVLFIVNPRYIAPLFSEPAGRAILGVALFFELLGAWVIRRLVRVEL